MRTPGRVDALIGAAALFATFAAPGLVQARREVPPPPDSLQRAVGNYSEGSRFREAFEVAVPDGLAVAAPDIAQLGREMMLAFDAQWARIGLGVAQPPAIDYLTVIYLEGVVAGVQAGLEVGTVTRRLGAVVVGASGGLHEGSGGSAETDFTLRGRSRPASPLSVR